MPEAYPLQWPVGWPRTPGHRRVRSSFHFGHKQRRYQQGAADEAATQELLRQLDLLKASNVVLSTNVELRRDGLPYAGRRVPDDPGVAVYFTLQKQQRCIPCDKWDRVACNVYAIARTIDALRQLDRDGTKGMMEAAFSGFKALPALGETSGRNWWDVLGVHPDIRDRALLDDAYKQLARKLHPDVTKERGPWDELQRAYDQAKQVTG